VGEVEGGRSPGCVRGGEKYLEAYVLSVPISKFSCCQTFLYPHFLVPTCSDLLGDLK
jgi:hypothetical protein